MRGEEQMVSAMSQWTNVVESKGAHAKEKPLS